MDDQTYIEEAILLLDFARNARKTFMEGTPAVRRHVLKLALSNSTGAHGALSVKFRQPFDNIAKAAEANRGFAGNAGANPAKRPEWWARQDSNLQPDRYERPALG
ncbi:MAG: hypothetical protein KIT48_01455 [Pseudolabrys sp.]|nr:hypothetical protein [Pseudolabrys sp.]